MCMFYTAPLEEALLDLFYTAPEEEALLDLFYTAPPEEALLDLLRSGSRGVFVWTVRLGAKKRIKTHSLVGFGCLSPILPKRHIVSLIRACLMVKKNESLF